jgi:GMP synthase-like glutamine amidotransferase
MQHNVLILDFSQYTQLIARRVHELNIFCEIFPYNHFPSDLSSSNSWGSPFSVRGEDRIQTYLKLGVTHACSMLWGTILSSF